MATRAPLDYEKLLTPAEMMAAWRVSDKTLVRWADRGYLTVRHTPGGHRRYLASETPDRMAAAKPDGAA